MKTKILIVLLLASVAFSGCMQSNPEERAIAIADQTPEARLISRMVDSMQRIDQCTFDKFYSGVKKIYEIEGTQMPEITESQRMQVEEGIQQMGALVKRCKIKLSKSAEKESENVYIVHYNFETISDPECSMLSGGIPKISVDLSTEKAEPIGDSQDIGKYEEIFEKMGDCAALMLVGSATQSAQVSETQTR